MFRREKRPLTCSESHSRAGVCGVRDLQTSLLVSAVYTHLPSPGPSPAGKEPEAAAQGAHSQDDHETYGPGTLCPAAPLLSMQILLFQASRLHATQALSCQPQQKEHRVPTLQESPRQRQSLQLQAGPCPRAPSEQEWRRHKPQFVLL